MFGLLLIVAVQSSSGPMVVPPTSKAVLDQAMEAWMACLRKAGDRYAQANEPAETVARASFGSCGDKEAVLRQAFLDQAKDIGLDPVQGLTKVDETLADLRRRAADVIIANVLDARAKPK